STRVRFVPNANFSGTVTNGLTFRAWDQTSGTVGGTANLSAAGSHGGTTAFSDNTETAAITVTPVNDAPALNNSGDLILTTIPTNAPATNPGDLVSNILTSAGGTPIMDVDGPGLGIAVVAVDNTNGTWEYSVDNGTTWTPFGTPSATTARLL